MIPELAGGVLPEGIHQCTLEEVSAAFGQFRRTDRRLRLTDQLERFVRDAQATGIVAAIVIDGSYVTAKDEPGDIDLIVVLRANFVFTEEALPMEYNIQSKRMVRKLYGFDIIPVTDGSEAYRRFLKFFSQVKPNDPDQLTVHERKGVLRIEL